MTELLTQAWADAVSSRTAVLATGPGGSGVVEWVVSGGEPDRLWVRWTVEDGRVVSLSVTDTASADDSGVEVTVPLTRAQAEAALVGEVDPAQAYMRGDLKPEGSSRAWLALLSALARADHRQVLAP